MSEKFDFSKQNRLMFTLQPFVTFDILYGCEVWGYSVSRGPWRKIQQIQKRCITYNLKIEKQYALLYCLHRSGCFCH